MRAHLDKVSQEHSELSKVIAEAATRMAEFKEAQKKDFKKVMKLSSCCFQHSETLFVLYE